MAGSGISSLRLPYTGSRMTDRSAEGIRGRVGDAFMFFGGSFVFFVLFLLFFVVFFVFFFSFLLARGERGNGFVFDGRVFLSVEVF